jgi:hypothetical protein
MPGADESTAPITAERLVKYLERTGARRDVQAAGGPAQKAWEPYRMG